ncbi:MAG: hypothetical protein COA67_06735 [Lutibacter sp.]|nr:MAG: hypothetical protein COA67_06735 [Lutibacter sp.]
MKTLSFKLLQKKTAVILFTLLVIINVKAQQTPDFQYTFDGQVKWMLLTHTGTVLASTGEALVGIKPNTNDFLFKFESLKKVKEENLEPIPNTPYLIVVPKGMLNQGHISVIDLIKGKIVFDSKKEKWQGGVTSRHVIQPNMMLVVNGMHKEKGLGQFKQGVGLYDLKTGELVRIFERKSSNPMTGRPDIMGDNIIIPGVKNIECYSISTGTVKWSTDIKNATSIMTNDITKEVYAFRTKGTNTVVYKVNATSGSLLWAEGNKLKGAINNIKFTDHGLAIVTNILGSGKKGLVGKIANKAKGSGTSKVYLLDLNSGADMWEKSPKTKGIINHFYIEDDGIIFGVASGGINKLAFDGTPLWKKPHKTGPSIQVLATVPKGLLYISETDTDILDINTGESVFGKALKYKRSKAVTSTYDSNRDRFLLSCKDGVYEIDGNNGEYNLINGDIKFEGKEAPTGIHVRDNGILLSSDQNLQMLNFNGDKGWEIYHRPPGKSAVGAIFMGALAIAATTVAVSESATAGYMKGSGVPSYNSTVRQHETNAANAAAIGDAAFTEMAKRFKATKATENASFILTKIDGGVGLIKVDKDSGETLDEILVKDKKPMYEIDDVEGILYFKSKGNTINAYKLNK